MNQLRTDYYKRANLSLLITTIAYLLINGAGAYETAVIIPVWTSNPPVSLGLLQGTYALDLKTFWITSHSLHEVTFIIAIIFNWKLAARRKALLIIFALHLALRVWTILYFAPTIISFQQMPVSAIADEALKQKAQLWKTLNLLRVALFTLLSFAMVPLNRQHFATPFSAKNNEVG